MPIVNFEKHKDKRHPDVELAMIGKREFGRIFDLPAKSGPSLTHFRGASFITGKAPIAMPEQSRVRAKRALTMQIAAFFEDINFAEVALAIRAQVPMLEEESSSVA